MKSHGQSTLIWDMRKGDTIVTNDAEYTTITIESIKRRNNVKREPWIIEWSDGSRFTYGDRARFRRV